MTDLRRPRLGPFTATTARPAARREDATPAPSERHGHAAHASPEALAGRPPSTGPAAPRRMPDIRGTLAQAGAAQRANLRHHIDTQDATFAHVIEMQNQQVAFSTGLAHIVEEAARRPVPQSHEEQLASAMELLDLSVRHQQATDAAWERFGSQRPAAAPAPAPSTLADDAMASAREQIGRRLSHRQAMQEARQEIGNWLGYEAAMAEAMAEMRGWTTQETAPSGNASRARTRRNRR